MQIEKKPIESLKPNTYNPNVIPEEKFKSLVNNIRKFGYLQPILIDKQGIIIDGEHRWKAAQEAGITEIECVIYEGNGDIKEYRKLLTLSMNNLRGENNQEAFEKVIAEIAYKLDYRELANLTGFDKEELKELLNQKDKYDFSDLDNELASMPGEEEIYIPVCIPRKHQDKVKDYLAYGEQKTSNGYGRGVMKRCGLL